MVSGSIPPHLRVFGFAFAALLALQGVARADDSVREHEVQCGKAFPCSEKLKPRVNFWIDVFSRWDKRDMILHDADQPWRVYDVVGWQDGCNTRKVKKTRSRLKANLNALADQLAKTGKPKGRMQSRLAATFAQSGSKASAKTARAAAKNLRCQPGVKDQYEAALARYVQYRPMILGIIRDMEMSEEFQYLPFVESSFRPTAYSKAGAAGMWQIMPRTARTLGMQIDATIDERLDPTAATRGAMRYFQDAEARLGEKAREKNPSVTAAELAPFIVTSYNYGIAGMRRAIDQLGPDFDRVLEKYKSKSFQVAVKNFYASFLAARYLAKNADQYFSGQPKKVAEPPVTLVLENATSIERVKSQFSLDEKDLKPLNPALTRFVWHNWRLIPAGYQLKLPPREGKWAGGSWEGAIKRLRALPPEEELTTNVVYRVRKGDTACAIARAFRVKCKDLIEVNRLGKRARIRIGQRLDIPGKFRQKTASEKSGKKVVAKAPKAQSDKAVSQKKSVVLATLGEDGRYRVKSGDTACGIANRFDASCRELIRLNRLGRGAKIVIGQALRIPGVTPSQKRARAQTGAATEQYTVKKGDTACEIAEAFDVPCSQLLKANRLGKRARIKVGQTLTIPGTERQEVASEVAPAPVAIPQDLAGMLDTLPDLSLASAQGHYTLTVMAEETLGHYSDWLRAGSIRGIAKLNGLKTGGGARGQLRPGKQIRLPEISAVQARQFNQRRAEFHQVLLESFKERFSVAGEKQVTAKKGDSLWEIARDQQAPLWLIYRLNPALLKGELRPGQTIRVPEVRARG